MTFKQGHSGNPGGRPKKLLLRPSEILAAHNKNPVEEILKIIPELMPRQQVETWLALMPYVASRLKESQGSDELLRELQLLSDEELKRRVKEALEKAA